MLSAKIIGHKIADARKKTNISQAQLAEQLFISPQAVGKWERGESMPDIVTFNRLAEILNVDLNYFSENTSPENGDAVVEELELTSAEQPAAKQPKKMNWDMSRGNWVDADFSGLKNLHEQFSSSNMLRCKFAGSDMSGLLLKKNNVDSCDFSGSDFAGSHIQGSFLSGNSFKDCSLKEAEFAGSYISGCDLSGADMTEVKMRSGGIEKSTLVQTTWNHTSFIETHLADLIFDGTITDCYFDNCSFTRVTFQDATLTNTFFKCKTLKHLKFINCQADRMTFEFLKNGKADVSGIELIAE